MAAPRLGASFFALPAQTRLFIQLQCFQSRPVATSILTSSTQQRYKTSYPSRNKNLRPAPSVKRGRIQSIAQPSITNTNTAKTNTIPTTTPIPTGQIAQSNNLAEAQILADDRPVILYEADKKLDRQFVGVAGVGALGMAGYGAGIWEFTLRNSIDTIWVNGVHYGIVGGLFTAAVYLWWGTCKSATKITAVPSSPANSQGGGGLRHVDLHIQGRGVIPFMTKTEVLDCRTVTRDYEFLDMQEQWWAWTEPSRQRRRPLSEIPPLIRPFDKFGRWCGEMFRETIHVMKKDNFNYLQVEGKPGFWRVDIRGNVLFDRRGLDTLVPLRGEKGA